MRILQKIKKKSKGLSATFEQITNEWLEYKKSNIKKSTYSNYEYIVTKYLIPYLKNKKLKQLKKYDFNCLIDKLSLELSPKTVRDIMCVLRAILRYIEEEYLYNLKIKKIQSPKQNSKNIIIFTKKEKNKIEQYCLQNNNIKELGILICLNTGLRIGEICALKWKNIDLDKRIIYVKNTLERIYDGNLKKTVIIIDKPKTISSIREIPISNKLYNVLKPIKKHYDNEAFFLTGEKEKYTEPRSYQYIYKNILKKTKIKSHKFHCLRHSFASECIEVGMDVKALSEILGHSSVNITLNRYVHPSYNMKKKYLEKI